VKEINDEKLIIDVKNGNLDSLVPLFDKYQGKIYNFFLRVTHDPVSSEDLTQTVFSRIIKYKSSYNEVYTFKSWIYQIARNVHVDSYSKKKLWITDEKLEENYQSDNRNAMDAMEKDDRNQTLKEALGLLSPEYREIIELSRFQDLKYEEISQITGNSVGAIRVKVHRAIKKLKDVYFQIA
jgi:RNA polymerase sigma-70 factor (ECF subfamily)